MQRYVLTIIIMIIIIILVIIVVIISATTYSSMEVKLKALLGNCDRPTVQPTKGRTWRFIEKLYFQSEKLKR